MTTIKQTLLETATHEWWNKMSARDRELLEIGFFSGWVQCVTVLAKLQESGATPQESHAQVPAHLKEAREWANSRSGPLDPRRN